MQIVFTYLFALPGEKYYVYNINELLLEASKEIYTKRTILLGII